MKILGKTEEPVIDTLLRAQAARLNFTGASCEGFDADLANAYVERTLDQTQQQRYESHIAACADCRRLTVSIMRAAQADLSATHNGRVTQAEKTSPGWITALRGFALTLATPRMALAATAVIALAVAVPLFLSSQNQRQDIAVQSSPNTESPNSPAIALAESQQQATSASDQMARNTKDARRASEADEGRAYGTAAPETNAKEGEESSGLLALAQTAPSEQPAPAPPPPAAEVSAKKEGDTASSAKTDESSRNAERSQPKASEPAISEAEKPLPRIDPREARTLPEPDKDSQPTPVPLTPGRIGVELPGDKEKRVIRPENQTPPRADSRTESSIPGRIAEGTGTSSLRDSAGRVKPPARSAREMKVQGKKFFLLDGVWTDKDYRKEKELPVVPVEQDSELYNQLAARHNKLKLYFDGLKDQSALIVYKGTVYKLTPKK